MGAGITAPILNQVVGPLACSIGEGFAVAGEILDAVAGAAVGVLRSAGHLIRGTAHLADRITGDAAERGLGAALDVTGRAAELIAVHGSLRMTGGKGEGGKGRGRLGRPRPGIDSGISACR